ncbi:hypothetical protein GC105_01255 [Alkalibaculum sp. M08DMB]|uniref:Uncharacterized protein n=1 Tax=Alkalibaculum sporogenes TaxID=2655001 RepID=A0A6A7K4N2_9FIRM|nr:hypothetical protein [Alkalibaculum sporogenes]MPW24419.1 hypothetical protein [Alkalibaculum sporogenes]
MKILRIIKTVEHSKVHIDLENRSISLDLTIDTKISSLMDYFEIFLTRMLMCRKAASFLDLKFELVMNGTQIL